MILSEKDRISQILWLSVKLASMLLFFYELFSLASTHPPSRPLTDDGVQALRGEVRFSEWGLATALIPLL